MVRCGFALLVVNAAIAHAADSAPRFEKDVAPIFERYCFQCHGEAVKMGKLDIRSLDAMLTGGSKGPALVKGSADKSLLYQRIADQSMPVGDRKLTAAEAVTVRDWINAGARSDAWSAALDPPKRANTHWAFHPPKRPTIPDVSHRAWVRTPVDAFILNQMERKGIQPAPAADRRTLIRRAYLTLLGLPPKPEEVRAFLQDRSPNVFDKLIEDLLSRPQYGERMARHWLDVVRYGESNGYERDGAKPNAWRYRDYVIDAFNKDKPYDRFVTEQLAGDEIEDWNAEAQIATTFLRLGTWDDEPAEPVLDRYDQLDDVLGVTAAAFMGVTLRCARCHDHKFEPFTQKDYYRTLAIFEPLKRPQKEREDLDRLVGTRAEVNAYEKATEKADAEIAELNKQVEEVRKAVLKRLFADRDKKSGGAGVGWLDHAETVLAFGTEPGKRTKRQKELVEKFNAKLDEAIRNAGTPEERTQFDASRKQIAEINAARPRELPRAYIWYEEGPNAPVTKILERGDPSRLGEQVLPGVPPVLQAIPDTQLGSPKPTGQSTGRRLWLARWMTDPRNPLLARVIVNRIWQWNFGEGLVPTENDFGVMGQRPSNPELLDYLASELIRSNWSLKHVQRLITKSSTFQTAAAWDERAGKIDPEGTLLWRWKPRRLEAEVVRDSMLAVSGQLNLEMAGPSVYPEVPRAVLEGQSRPGDGWGKSDEKQASRRSIYIFVKRSVAVPELEVLDSPDTTSSCEQRPVSTTAPQALTFLNGLFTQQQAKKLAAHLDNGAGPEQVAKAFELVFSRAPKPEESKASLEFLAHGATLEEFCLVLLNSNEFFYLN